MAIPYKLGPLLAAALALISIAATCVTNVRQKGDMGPWVGEVVNTGDSVVYDVKVRPRIYDGYDERIPPDTVSTCPSTLKPGQRGAWEAFLRREEKLPVEMRSAIATNSPIDSGLESRGLKVHLFDRNVRRKYATIQVTNEATFYYHWVMICGTLRSPEGVLEEVGTTGMFPFLSLAPRETRTKLIYFNSMPEGDFEFFAVGKRVETGNEYRLPPAALRIVNTHTLIDSAGDPYLEVLAELTNPFDVPLEGLMAATHVKGFLELRDEDIELACGGAAGPSETVPIKFSMPTAGIHAKNVPVIERISAISGAFVQIPVPVTEPRIVDEHLVGTFSNPTDQGLAVYGICVGVRRGGKLIDAFSASVGPYLHPNTTIEVPVLNALLPAYDEGTFEVIAYGVPAPAPEVH